MEITICKQKKLFKIGENLKFFQKNFNFFFDFFFKIMKWQGIHEIEA